MLGLSQVDADDVARQAQLLEAGAVGRHVSEFDVGDDDVARHDGGQPGRRKAFQCRAVRQGSCRYHKLNFDIRERFDEKDRSGRGTQFSRAREIDKFADASRIPADIDIEVDTASAAIQWLPNGLAFLRAGNHSNCQGQRARFMADHDATGMPLSISRICSGTNLTTGDFKRAVPPLLLPAPVTM